MNSLPSQPRLFLSYFFILIVSCHIHSFSLFLCLIPFFVFLQGSWVSPSCLRTYHKCNAEERKRSALLGPYIGTSHFPTITVTPHSLHGYVSHMARSADRDCPRPVEGDPDSPTEHRIPLPQFFETLIVSIAGRRLPETWCFGAWRLKRTSAEAAVLLLNKSSSNSCG